ncbi:MAG: hypothetical protein JO151_13465 [Verrucomicrobia bacterium]|nr:hypothetical protein [Verrucomicrobiota bacterium]
MLKLLKGARSV